MDLRGRELWSVWVLLAVLVTAVPAPIASAQPRGDVNCSGRVAADDLAALAAVIFDDASSDCAEADVNADGRISSADVTALVDVLETPVAIGPVVTFFGLVNAEGGLIDKSGINPDGIPVFARLVGLSFSIVVEGKPGSSRAAVGWCALGTPVIDQFPLACTPDLTNFPDLQIEASNPLGNGSPAVCDRSGPNAGGVPGVAPVSFVPTQTNIDAVNDLACRFIDGNGAPIGRPSTYGCVEQLPSEEEGYANPESKMQFCAPITSVEQFPPATDTALTVRLRDVSGNVGAPAQIIVHIGP